jgi:hypothetical protein
MSPMKRPGILRMSTPQHSEAEGQIRERHSPGSRRRPRSG